MGSILGAPDSWKLPCRDLRYGASFRIVSVSLVFSNRVEEGKGGLVHVLSA